jgi:two-component sensor histidine kinase
MDTQLRILLIEDSEDDAVLLLRELRRSGFALTFERVDKPDAMLAALHQQSWDLIVCDYSMPEFSAPAALKLLQEQHLDIPFIIVSATIGEDVAVAAMKAGAHDYIIKGKLARLAPAIERELREAKVRLARRQAEEQIKASLREKEALLREIHHRVKNNLQIISSLLNLQAEYLKDNQALEVFQNSQNRIELMALIHEKLYQSEDLAKINFAEYIQELATNLFSAYTLKSDALDLALDLEDVFLDIDTAVPCGLIVNELVSNALKHAFPSGKSGKVCVKLYSVNHNKTVLIINDDGVGFFEEIDFRNTESLGLQLVNTLTQQIDGTIDLNKSHGSEFKIIFPK